MISAVVLTKNEEKNIKDCLKSLSWCDEIVVIDDHSQDKTVEIASKMGTRSFINRLNNNFARQRNFGLEKAKEDWVFFVDADERISAALAAEIKSQISCRRPPAGGLWRRTANLKSQSHNLKLKASQPVGFYLKRRDFIFGKWLEFGETGKIKLLRLAQKNAGQWKGTVHEVWKIKGKVNELNNPLFHFPHPTISQFLEKINQYSTIRARDLYNQGIKTNFGEIITYPVAKFLKNFVWNLGFLDGLPGFLHAIFMSFHSFLVRGKLWLLCNSAL